MNSKELVLDIGCGHSNHLDIYSNPNYQVIGLDYQSSVLKKRSDGNFIQGSAPELPFSSHTFDQVYILSSLEHITNPNAVLCEAHRVLKPQGRVVIDVPHPNYEKVMGLIAKDSGYHDNGMHCHIFQPDEIRRIVEDAGFSVQEFSPRMWKAAVVITTRWLRAKLTGRLEFDDDTGELTLLKPEQKTKMREVIDRLLWLSENKNASPKRYALLSLLRLPNKIYPWVTYIEATKRL